MKKTSTLLAMLSLTAVAACSQPAVVGTANEEENVVEFQSSSSAMEWPIYLLGGALACAVACGGNGGGHEEHVGP